MNKHFRLAAHSAESFKHYVSPADLSEIDGAAAKITVQGNRYPEHLEKMTGR